MTTRKALIIGGSLLAAAAAGYTVYCKTTKQRAGARVLRQIIHLQKERALYKPGVWNLQAAFALQGFQSDQDGELEALVGDLNYFLMKDGMRVVECQDTTTIVVERLAASFVSEDFAKNILPFFKVPPRDPLSLKLGIVGPYEEYQQEYETIYLNSIWLLGYFNKYALICGEGYEIYENEGAAKLRAQEINEQGIILHICRETIQKYLRIYKEKVGNH